MQLSSEPKGWSDAEVDQLLLSVSNIEQHTANINDWIYISMDSSTMTTFIIATLLGYFVSAWFLPATTDIGRW